MAVELPDELGVDLIKSRQIIENLIFKVSDVESEYSQHYCITGWLNLSETRKKYIPEEMWSTWDKELDWYLKANELMEKIEHIRPSYNSKIPIGQRYIKHYISLIRTMRYTNWLIKIVKNRPSYSIQKKLRSVENKLDALERDFKCT